jgi:hypothetical protein
MCHGEKLTPKPLETKMEASVCDFCFVPHAPTIVQRGDFNLDQTTMV